jgi:hypothetical protein
VPEWAIPEHWGEWGGDPTPILAAAQVAFDLMQEVGTVTLNGRLEWEGGEALEHSVADVRKRLRLSKPPNRVSMILTAEDLEVHIFGQLLGNYKAVTARGQDFDLTDHVFEAARAALEGEEVSAPPDPSSTPAPSARPGPPAKGTSPEVAPPDTCHTGLIGWIESRPVLTSTIVGLLLVAATIVAAIIIVNHN